ncbi:hypothetical protein IFR04_008115 [Cadophora malorum]|uniref:Uncharacterized protein n=1 Tax=Cadophora malorum TaxID=108018 RepID=A0A8H7WA47_9HELO|nr:hypothetical protein IFR04_008115 [Cadophora malorum]
MDTETLSDHLVELAYGPKELYVDNTYRRILDSRYTEIVGFDFFCALDDAIETALIDWWLSDDAFWGEVKAFEHWQDEVEDGMAWELMDVWETWYGADGHVKIRKASEREKVSYDKAMKKLLCEHEKKKVSIEAEAVRIGL